MKYITVVILLSMMGLSCKQHQPETKKKSGFLIGDWMICNDADKPNTNLCATLTFENDDKGSVRTVKSIDLPFSWTYKNNILTIRSLDNQQRQADFIDRVYQVDTSPTLDGHGTRLVDTISHMRYYLVK